MASIDVLTTKGKKAESLELDDHYFGIEPRVHVMHEVVVAQRAATRADNAKTKTRGEVRGGGKKPWRQKGTGRARHGSTRSPIWRGGGTVFGPTGNQNHKKKVNKKVKSLALRSALSARLADGAIRILDTYSFDTPKTKNAVELLTNLGLENTKILYVLAGSEPNTILSFSNLPNVHLIIVDQINTYDVLNAEVVIIEKNAVPFIGTGLSTDFAEIITDEELAELEASAQAEAGTDTEGDN